MAQVFLELLISCSSWSGGAFSSLGMATCCCLARDLAPQEQALQQQRQFVNQLAHELNTPLAIVGGSLRQLGKKLLEFGDGSRERLHQAQQETSRLVRLLRHLLVLTDLETGRRQLQLQPLALKPWLQEWMAQQVLPASAA